MSSQQIAGYYYLTDTDIIQEGDEFWTSMLSWSRCISSVGRTISQGLSIRPDTKVRRRLIKTEKGNSL